MSLPLTGRGSCAPLIRLAAGVSKVTFQIDPYRKTPETEEGNNSFPVMITVRP